MNARINALQCAPEPLREVSLDDKYTATEGRIYLSGIQALWHANKHLEAHHVKFIPGINEELAATAVWGPQQVQLLGDVKYDGVFGLWYGKGLGVDHSINVFKHIPTQSSAKKGMR